MRLHRCTWNEFDAVVTCLARHIKEHAQGATAIAGVPRGGLPLAVALSHATGLPLATPKAPTLGRTTVMADDIIDTGATLAAHAGVLMFVAWFTRPGTAMPPHAHAQLTTSDWIVFPWENPANALEDFNDYRARRGVTTC